MLRACTQGYFELRFVTQKEKKHGWLALLTMETNPHFSSQKPVRDVVFFLFFFYIMAGERLPLLLKSICFAANLKKKKKEASLHNYRYNVGERALLSYHHSTANASLLWLFLLSAVRWYLLSGCWCCNFTLSLSGINSRLSISHLKVPWSDIFECFFFRLRHQNNCRKKHQIFSHRYTVSEPFHISASVVVLYIFFEVRRRHILQVI